MYNITVNGQPFAAEVDAETPLLWVLRDEADLKGTKFGCGIGMCGACTVHVDGATQAPQCGYCQSGQIMQAATLLQDYPQPTDANIDAVMSGNLCRCMAYVRIRKAIKLAAAAMQGELPHV